MGIHKSQQGALLFRFSQNSCSSSISDSTEWNRTKFWMQYTYFRRLYSYIFSEHISQGGAVVTIFIIFLGKCRFCVLLNKKAQKFMRNIYIIKDKNYTFYVCIAQ